MDLKIEEEREQNIVDRQSEAILQPHLLSSRFARTYASAYHQPHLPRTNDV